MLLIKLTDGVPDKYPITLENFLLLFPATSFPGYLDASITEPLGYGIYTFMGVPRDYDKSSQKVVELLPLRNDETGVWEQQWGIEPLTPEEKIEVDLKKRHEVIWERNSKLTASDWTQLPDAPLTDELKAQWSDYRKQLRDLPDTEAFNDIWNIVWPKQPHPLMGDGQVPPNVI